MLSRPDQTNDPITNRLKEIRNNSNPEKSSQYSRKAIEKSIEQHVQNGLSLSEVVEYEANQTRMKQLQEKMCKINEFNQNQNQYSAKKQTHHA